MTIEERADKIFCDKDGYVLDIAHDYMRIGYIKGAEEQQQIDAHKFSVVFCELYCGESKRMSCDLASKTCTVLARFLQSGMK